MTKYTGSGLWKHLSQCLNGDLNRDIWACLYMVFELVPWNTVLITINAAYGIMFITVPVLLLQNALNNLNVTV